MTCFNKQTKYLNSSNINVAVQSIQIKLISLFLMPASKYRLWTKFTAKFHQTAMMPKRAILLWALSQQLLLMTLKMLQRTLQAIANTPHSLRLNNLHLTSNCTKKTSPPNNHSLVLTKNQFKKTSKLWAKNS